MWVGIIKIHAIAGVVVCCLDLVGWVVTIDESLEVGVVLLRQVLRDFALFLVPLLVGLVVI